MPAPSPAFLRIALLLLCVAATAAQEVRQPPARGASLFDSQAIFEFTLTASFDELFARSDAEPNATVPASISYKDPASGREVELHGLEVAVRGNTSRRQTECSFPKLKLKLPDRETADQPLCAGLKRLRIGTHCNDLPDGQLTFQYGRWGNEKSPLREDLVYRLLNAVNVPTLRARPARITYVFASGADMAGSAAVSDRGSGARRTRRTIVRNALLLEDEAQALERLHAVGVLTPAGEKAGEAEGKVVGRFENAERQFAARDSVAVALAEAMVGNFDWGLKFNAEDTFRDDGKKGLWNVLALVRKDGSAFPLLQDFDLAGVVVGRHPWYRDVYPERFMEAQTPAAVETLSQVQRTRSLFDRPVLDAARTFFLGRRQDLQAAVAESPADPQGKEFANAYLRAFFDAIGSDEAFYRPVVVRDGVTAFADPRRSVPACGPTFLRGTPVAAAGDASGGLLRVDVLDVRWRWEKEGCPAIRKAPVWVDASAIGRNYPPR